MSDTSPAASPPTLDPVASARWNHWLHLRSPWLHEEVARRMQERLQWIRLKPTAWIDWAPLSGGLDAHDLVRARYPAAQCRVVETSPAREAQARKLLQAPWWQRLFKPAALVFGPAPDASADMVWANMALHVTSDPQALLRQWHQMLAVDGFLMFSCLGPDTLRELGELFAREGWPPLSHAFTDMHDWGDMLVQAGFAEPVMDMERLTLTYDSPESLLRELRGLGRNLHRERFPALRGKAWLARLKKALSSLRHDEQDRLRVTVEVIYGHALKPIPHLKITGESMVSLQDMRSILGQSLRK